MLPKTGIKQKPFEVFRISTDTKMSLKTRILCDQNGYCRVNVSDLSRDRKLLFCDLDVNPTLRSKIAKVLYLIDFC